MRQFLELDGDMFVRREIATDEEWRRAADLSSKRLRRCSPHSDTWNWHSYVVAEHERRRRNRLRLVTS